MMSLQLGETFSGFKMQRLVQWVLRPPNPLLSKYNELPKTPPPPAQLVSKELLQPCLMHLQILIFFPTGMVRCFKSSKPWLTILFFKLKFGKKTFPWLIANEPSERRRLDGEPAAE